MVTQNTNVLFKKLIRQVFIIKLCKAGNENQVTPKVNNIAIGKLRIVANNNKIDLNVFIYYISPMKIYIPLLHLLLKIP